MSDDAQTIEVRMLGAGDADVLANGYVTEMEYPEHGKTLKVHGSPWHFSETPAKVKRAPGLGEHGREIALEAGLSIAAVDALVGRGILGDGPSDPGASNA